jgi:hypothetical protein
MTIHLLKEDDYIAILRKMRTIHLDCAGVKCHGCVCFNTNGDERCLAGGIHKSIEKILYNKDMRR